MARPVADSALYSVQRCLDLETQSFDAGRNVTAPSAFQAAVKEFGSPVSMQGPPSQLIGRVVGLGADFKPTVLMIYRDMAARA